MYDTSKTYEENLNEFKKRGIEVIGISKDSVASPLTLLVNITLRLRF